jgi:stage V sporulation protein B
MSKAGDIAKVSAKGSFHLLWGLVLSTVISAVGTIFAARLLGADLYGLYAIVLIAPNTFATFRDWGINHALIRYTAQYKAENRTEEIRSIFLSGLIFEVLIGSALSLISFILSDYIALNIFNRPAIAPLIQIASLTILATGLTSTASAAFTGMERMQFNSVIQVSQAIIRSILVITLIILGLSTSGAVVGTAAATIIAGAIGLFLMWTIYRQLPKPRTLKLEIKAYTQEMLRYAIPLSLSFILVGFLAQFYTFLLPIHYVADNTLIGNYNIAQTFVVLISFFALPIVIMLFPAFSKIDHKKDKETLKSMYQFSIKYASLLVVPAAALVMALSEPAISTLFGDTYQTAPLFLTLLAVAYLYTAFGQLSNENLINGQGQTKITLKLTLLHASIGFPMGSILIIQFGVLGLIFTTLTAGLPSIIIALYWIKKQYGLTVDWKSSAKIVLASALTATLTYVLISQLEFASWLRLIIGTISFVLILLPTIIFTRSITELDISNLKTMADGLGSLSKLINKILNFIEKLMIALEKTKLKTNRSR